MGVVLFEGSFLLENVNTTQDFSKKEKQINVPHQVECTFRIYLVKSGKGDRPTNGDVDEQLCVDSHCRRTTEQILKCARTGLCKTLMIRSRHGHNHWSCGSVLLMERMEHRHCRGRFVDARLTFLLFFLPQDSPFTPGIEPLVLF